MLTITNCPKCGQKLADGATRCSVAGCDYELPAGVKAGPPSDASDLFSQILSQKLGNAIGDIQAARATPDDNPLPESGVCDRCNGSIPKGEGYSFFSSASMQVPGMKQLTGNMLLCEDCTTKIMTPEQWRKEIPKQRELSGTDILANPNALLDMMHEVNADSIVQNCKERGLTPEQAKAKAREFAKRWWTAPEATQRESAKFWTSSSSTPAAPTQVAVHCAKTGRAMKSELI